MRGPFRFVTTECKAHMHSPMGETEDYPVELPLLEMTDRLFAKCMICVKVFSKNDVTVHLNTHKWGALYAKIRCNTEPTGQ